MIRVADVVDVDAPQELKEMMQSSIFDMKESMKKEDIDLEGSMKSEEQLTGVPGPRGNPGFDGKNGVPGVVSTPTPMRSCMCACLSRAACKALVLRAESVCQVAKSRSTEPLSSIIPLLCVQFRKGLAAPT